MSPRGLRGIGPSPLLNKPSYIPKLESPFRFLQHHKKCFEVIFSILMSFRATLWKRGSLPQFSLFGHGFSIKIYVD